MNSPTTNNKQFIEARQVLGKSVGLLKPTEITRLSKIINLNKWDRFYLEWRKRIAQGERPYATLLAILAEFEREDD